MSHKLGKMEIFSVALGSVIGWGAFVLPGNVFLKSHGLLNTAIDFTIAILMLLFIEKSYSMVMERVPKSGGEYSEPPRVYRRVDYLSQAALSDSLRLS